ncbi:MAG: hypothetical protein FJX71_06395 [Alphaproteobacteria bacterium]|nr:hypothetical protein [Alphaproteobacteria bacterium]
MIVHIAKKISAFRTEDRGGILVFVGICLLPMLLMLGLAVDSSFGLAQKRKLQMAVDAAAKAGSVNGAGENDAVTAEVQKIFNANTVNMKNVNGPVTTIDIDNNALTVSASVVVSNMFMTLGGIPTSTYTASTTVPLSNSNYYEIAIIYEVSARFQGGGFHNKICNALMDFVNGLPDNVLVSITPIATEILLDSTNTVPNNLFNHLSMATDDESAGPAFFPLSTNYGWSMTSYNAVTNPFYTTSGYSTLTSNPLPSICPGGYPSCPPSMWPDKCPPLNTNTSCSQVYSYKNNQIFPILPLTMNKSLIIKYLKDLQNYVAPSDGLFPSLITWGWRTIDPAWRDFWKVNTDSANTLRTAGDYPHSYARKRKSVVIIFDGAQYWDGYATNLGNYYNNKCGDASTEAGGMNHWWMTAYGIVPVPTDYISTVDDITCENKSYTTLDKGLGLNLSDNKNYKATVSSTSYKDAILNESLAKFLRICTNMKAKNIDIFLLSPSNISTLAPCCNSSSNAYTITNANSVILAAMQAAKAKILTKIS